MTVIKLIFVGVVLGGAIVIALVRMAVRHMIASYLGW